MNTFLHITDTHFTSSSNTRVGDYFEDLCVKFEYFIDKCNELKAVPLHSGDFFDKPSVPDFVKSRLMQILKKAWTPVLTITGNHDRLFGSDDRFHRTSLSILAESGLIEIINNNLVEFEECFVVPIGPNSQLVPRDKPQIALGHGFLNQEDGLNTVLFQDILSDSENIVILGHDHAYYEPVLYRNTRILRPGSFARGIRNDSSDRIPIMVLITVNAGEVKFEEMEIEVAKPVELLFKERKSMIGKSEITYETLIEQIKATSSDEQTLEHSLRMVTDDETVGYILETLNQLSLNKIK